MRLLLCAIKTLRDYRTKSLDVGPKPGSVRTLWNYTSVVFHSCNYYDTWCRSLQNKIASLNFTCTRKPILDAVVLVVVFLVVQLFTRWTMPHQCIVEQEGDWSWRTLVVRSLTGQNKPSETVIEYIYDLKLSSRLNNIQRTHNHADVVSVFCYITKMLT